MEQQGGIGSSSRFVKVPTGLERGTVPLSVTENDAGCDTAIRTANVFLILGRPSLNYRVRKKLPKS